MSIVTFEHGFLEYCLFDRDAEPVPDAPAGLIRTLRPEPRPEPRPEQASLVPAAAAPGGPAAVPADPAVVRPALLAGEERELPDPWIFRGTD
ncbi:hypothetical protein QIS99_29850 [Streptomyces sp. B-S-A8]|uniref:Uncharacterized protein n=1 Tax=Streptomyces solicavernae TaxID=3043614 RepID=A0ABT6S0Z4_9ACTN|nr:hypothetical protein [Streptomyces sp. B-S-A8]MDI3390365.1 hypothetical protein [Streptomyces sp. B-S-A8]